MSCPKNVSGTLTGSVGIGRTCQNNTLRVRNQGTTSGTVTVVDDLIVRNTLISNQQTGGTLTLNGTASVNPTYEAALVVNAGARFAGLTQHKLLRVLETSSFGGPISASQIYGPLAVSVDPAVSTVSPALTVAGVTQTDVITADIANFRIASSEAFSVNGYLVGPDAAAEVFRLVTPRVVLVTNAFGTAQTLGYTVSEDLVLTTLQVAGCSSAPKLSWFYDEAPARVVSQQNSTGSKAYLLDAVTPVSAISRSGNLALIKLAAPELQAPLLVNIADFIDYADSPPLSTDVIVVYSDPVRGTIQFATGVVSNNSAQAFEEYSTLEVSLTGSSVSGVGNGTLPAGSNGALVFDYRGTLLGLIQYGVEGSYANAISRLNFVVGAIKGRYLNYFLSNYAPSPPTVQIIPLLTAGGFQSSRGIGMQFRKPGFLYGGITNFASGDPPTTADQYLKIQGNEAADPPSQPLGLYGNNFPSLQDQMLVAKILGNTNFLAFNGDFTAPAGPVTLTGAFVSTNGANWTSTLGGNLAPDNLSVPLTVQYATSTLQAAHGSLFVNNATSLLATKLVLTNFTSIKASLGQVVAVIQGSATQTVFDANTTASVLASGYARAVNAFLTTHYPAQWVGSAAYSVYTTATDASSMTVLGYKNASSQLVFNDAKLYTIGSNAGDKGTVTTQILNAATQQVVYTDLSGVIWSRTTTFPSETYNSWTFSTNVSINPLDVTSTMALDKVLCTTTYEGTTPSGPVAISDSVSLNPTANPAYQ